MQENNMLQSFKIGMEQSFLVYIQSYFFMKRYSISTSEGSFWGLVIRLWATCISSTLQNLANLNFQGSRLVYVTSR